MIFIVSNEYFLFEKNRKIIKFRETKTFSS